MTQIKLIVDGENVYDSTSVGDANSATPKSSVMKTSPTYSRVMEPTKNNMYFYKKSDHPNNMNNSGLGSIRGDMQGEPEEYIEVKLVAVQSVKGQFGPTTMYGVKDLNEKDANKAYFNVHRLYEQSNMGGGRRTKSRKQKRRVRKSRRNRRR